MSLIECKKGQKVATIQSKNVPLKMKAIDSDPSSVWYIPFLLLLLLLLLLCEHIWYISKSIPKDLRAKYIWISCEGYVRVCVIDREKAKRLLQCQAFWDCSRDTILLYFMFLTCYPALELMFVTLVVSLFLLQTYTNTHTYIYVVDMFTRHACLWKVAGVLIPSSQRKK